jgi:sugar/nucleoside kinase (ribokinase family)
VHHAHGNERELARFSGCTDIQSACRFLIDQGCSEIVVHRGDKGAASFTADQGWIEAPAVPVASVVSSTGSGDVFCAAHMLLHGVETPQRLRESAKIAADHLSGRLNLIPPSSAD